MHGKFDCSVKAIAEASPLPARPSSGQDANIGRLDIAMGLRRWQGYGFLFTTLMALVMASAASAQDYFRGKTIRLVVATPPGGGYDTYGRIVGRYLGEFLPGHPAVTVVNMPGASGMNAVSWLYSQAPRDGTVIATFNKSQPFYQALGQQGVRFKTEELSWIGTVSQAADLVSVWHTTGVTHHRRRQDQAGRHGLQLRRHDDALSCAAQRDAWHPLQDRDRIPRERRCLARHGEGRGRRHRQRTLDHPGRQRGRPGSRTSRSFRWCRWG